MNKSSKIVEVTSENITEFPQAICFINPKHPLFYKKVEWLKEQFRLGLKIKMLYVQDNKNPLVLLNMFPENIAGDRLMPKVICLSIVFGQMGKNTSTRVWVISY